MTKIITVGNIKEKYLKDAIEEYTKRIKKYTTFDKKIIEPTNQYNESIYQTAKEYKGQIKYLEKFAKVLQITEVEELNAFYDSAGVSKNGQHSDINTYIDGLPSARVALRAAKDKKYTDEDWRRLVEIINSKK